MHCSAQINLQTQIGKSRLVGETIYGDFCSAIKEIYSEYDIEVTYSYSEKIDAHDCAIGGSYAPDDDLLTIELIVSPESSTIRIKEAEWQGFAFLLAQTIQHELIHRYQYTIRDLDATLERIEYYGGVNSEERDYYSEDDEIHAYSHCLALELTNKYKGKRLEKVLRCPDLIRGCPTWTVYKKIFRKTNWLDIRRALLKHTIKWLPTAIPYKDNE